MTSRFSACTDQSTQAPVPVTVDQRGIFRPQGAGCDIGAYELAAAGAFQVRYVSNLDVGDSVIDITNDGQSVPLSYGIGTPGRSNLCIGVYTFDAQSRTPVLLRLLRYAEWIGQPFRSALTATSLTGEKPTSLVVKLLAWSTTAGASSTAPPGTPAPPTSSSLQSSHAWGYLRRDACVGHYGLHALPAPSPPTP